MKESLFKKKGPPETGGLFLSPQQSTGRWRCGRFLLNYQRRPLIMGILNVTPDSFSDGGNFLDPKKAVDQALRLVSEGADIIDIGGESTRPGALPVPLEEESRRVLPVIKVLAKEAEVPISVDTRKPEIARRAIASGASIINDVSGLNANPEMLDVTAQEKKIGLILMHAQGTPQSMQKAPRYRDLIGEIYRFFQQRIAQAKEVQISADRLAIDPGIGFGKTVRHNLRLIHHLEQFMDLGVPLLIGPSRKSFIGRMLDLPPSERLEGTAAAIAIAVFQGAKILRVHDVMEMRRVAVIAEGIRKQAPRKF